MAKFLVITLGCKVNKYDSAAIESLLTEAGHEPAAEGTEPDVVIVNTCCVTSPAEQQSRHAARKARREHPGARVVVCGCSSQVSPGDFSAMDGVDLVLGNRDKRWMAGSIISLLAGGGTRSPEKTLGEPDIFDDPPVRSFLRQTRAYLKIQDGCDNSCSFCIVPKARGASRSIPLKEAVARVRSLGEAGYREIVLTGIHLGAYGSDLGNGVSLAALLDELAHTGIPRLRLSSLDPDELDGEFIGAVARNASMCAHFHVSVQSLDDGILGLMNRKYGADEAGEVIHGLREKFPDAAIGVDIIAGFPGETGEHFESTVRSLSALPVTYVHAFPFSPRKGTPAASMPGAVSSQESRRRAGVLREIGLRKKELFYAGFIGRDLEVLLESEGGFSSRGTSRNYIPVTIPGNGHHRNTEVVSRITGAGQSGLIGRATG